MGRVFEFELLGLTWFLFSVLALCEGGEIEAQNCLPPQNPARAGHKASYNH
jgi:hypothetical protein